jgi:hypothetical protein
MEKSAQVNKIQLICCGQGFNKEYQGHYNRYKVLIDGVPLENLYTAERLKELPYWSSRSNVMAMTTWGQSQEFEAQLKIGAFIWGYNKNKQEWGEYTRDLLKKIEVIY